MENPANLFQNNDFEYQSRKRIVSKHAGGLCHHGSGVKEYTLQRLKGGWLWEEHQSMGNHLQLPGLGYQGAQRYFPLKDGKLMISFSEIIAYAGDFYGLAYPEKPISDISGVSDGHEKTLNRFKKAYDDLFNSEWPITEIPQLQDFQVEESQPMSAIMQRSPFDMFSQMSKLALNNSDHFGENAQESYLVGHQWARQVAMNEKNLLQAYSIEAFALHFLTDLYSSGHVRTPRGMLEWKINQMYKQYGFKDDQEWLLFNYWSSMLTLAMHEEECANGLEINTIANEREKGLPWKAYGDGFFFDKDNKDNKQNRQMLELALSVAVNEIYEASKATKLSATQMPDYFVFPTKNNYIPIWEFKGHRWFARGNMEQIDCQTQTEIKTINDLQGITSQISETIGQEVFLKYFSRDLISVVPKLPSCLSTFFHYLCCCCLCSVQRDKEHVDHLSNVNKKLINSAQKGKPTNNEETDRMVKNNSKQQYQKIAPSSAQQSYDFGTPDVQFCTCLNQEPGLKQYLVAPKAPELLKQ